MVALQLDEKPSIIVDYGNGGGDEIRLVNAKKRIYLGRYILGGYGVHSSIDSIDQLDIQSIHHT